MLYEHIMGVYIIFKILLIYIYIYLGSSINHIIFLFIDFLFIYIINLDV